MVRTREDYLEQLRGFIRQMRSETEARTRWDIAEGALSVIDIIEKDPAVVLCDDDVDVICSNRGYH